MINHNCAADGHRWGMRSGVDAFAGQSFWVCIERGRVEPGPERRYAEQEIVRIVTAMAELEALKRKLE